jgi:hypothetical protein
MRFAERYTARSWLGLGLFIGIGFGQTTAWLFLRGVCPSAPGMIALSTFGPGMTITGLLLLSRRVMEN